MKKTDSTTKKTANITRTHCPVCKLYAYFNSKEYGRSKCFNCGHEDMDLLLFHNEGMCSCTTTTITSHGSSDNRTMNISVKDGLAGDIEFTIIGSIEIADFLRAMREVEENI